MNHLVFVLSWIYIYPWFDYCPSPSCLKRWANPCLSLINWVNPYLLNNANGITRTAIGMTNKQKHAQFHHVAVPLSEPCRQMSLSEPKHTNTTVLLLLGANYNSKWIFFCARVCDLGEEFRESKHSYLPRQGAERHCSVWEPLMLITDSRFDLESS